MANLRNYFILTSLNLQNNSLFPTPGSGSIILQEWQESRLKAIFLLIKVAVQWADVKNESNLLHLLSHDVLP